MTLRIIEATEAERTRIRDLCDEAAGYPWPCVDARGRPNGRHTAHVGAITEEGVLITPEVPREIDASRASQRMRPQDFTELQALVANAREVGNGRVSETPAEPRLGVGNGNGRP